MTMNDSKIEIGFGGGCHWCTEAVFQSLIGVDHVKQGWIASDGPNTAFSEAIVVTYDSNLIDLKTLIAIHLRTHKSTTQHSMREKYRSAIYIKSKSQSAEVIAIIKELQEQFEESIITKTLAFIEFKESDEMFKNYYQKNPTKPFCRTYIDPKLKLLLTKFRKNIDLEAVPHLTISSDN